MPSSPVERERKLDVVSAGSFTVPRERIEQYLRLGCQELGMELAVVAGTESSETRILACLATRSGACPGSVVLATSIFERIAQEPDEVIAVTDTEAEGWGRIGPDSEQGIASFIACRASSARNVVLCLTSRRFRTRHFTADDRSFAQRLAMRLDYELRIAQKEDELSLSRALFETFMNHSPVAAFLKTQDGTHLYANRPKEEGLRLWAESFLGRNDFETLARDVALRIHAADRRVFEEGEPVDLIEEMFVPDVGPRHFHLLKFPVQTPDGSNLIGSVAIDVT